MNYNKVILGGRITKDLELKTSGSGTYYCQFTVAVDVGGKEKKTSFIECTAFGKTAEFLTQYFGKGSNVLVEGRLQTDTYEKDGQKRSSTKVAADSVFFVDSKKTETKPETKQETFEELGDGSDLPF